MSWKSLRTPAGKLAYRDVGNGPPIVFLHGNPTSSYLYRYLIRDLLPRHRCIAPDYLGFGRSDAPLSFSYTPASHATLVEVLIERLGLSNITLVLHDWGGPIGFSYLLRHPDRVRRLILTNTWAWPLTQRPLLQLVSRLFGTPIGRLAVEEFNAFARLVMPLTGGRSSKAVPRWLRLYADNLNSRGRRRACWTFARSLAAETDWLRTLWSRRDRIQSLPVLLCWGMADPAFGHEQTLRRWQTLFPDASHKRFPDVGHYVPEELGQALLRPVSDFLQATTPRGAPI